MDIRKVKKLIEMLEESQLNEIEIKEGEESVKLVKAISVPVQEQIVTSNAVAPTPQPAVENDNVSADSDTSQSACLLYTSPSPRDQLTSRLPSSA